MEQIDILNEEGQQTGEVRSKEDVHKFGLWHKSVHIWFVNSKNEVLLQLRSSTKHSHPNHWDISAAGHVAAGEDSLVSAQREIEEEIGISLQKEDLTLIGQVVEQSVQNNGTYINNEFDDVYLVRKDIDTDQFVFNDQEVQKVQYVSKDELKEWVKRAKEDLVPHTEEYELLFSHI